MKPSRLIRASGLGLLLLVAAACHNPPPATEAAAAPMADPKPAAGSPGKPGMPMTISFMAHGIPALNSPLQIDVRLTPTAPLTDVRVDLSAEGLDWVGGARQLAAPSLARDQALSGTVTVLPRSEGNFFLRLALQATRGGRTVSAVQLYPVTVGTVEPKSRNDLQTTPEGDRIVPMPVQESGKR